MQSTGHEVVHNVIIIGNVRKYTFHPTLFFGNGYRFITEVSGGAGDVGSNNIVGRPDGDGSGG